MTSGTVLDGRLRAVVSCLVALAVVVFVFGEVLLVRTYRTVDGSPGLSLEDVQLAFTHRSQSLLEARLKTDMREHLDDAELGAVLGWIRAGASRDAYDKEIAGVVEDRCTKCHKDGGSASFRHLASFADVQDALAAPPSPPFREMVTITKVHLLGLGLLVAVPMLIGARSPRVAALQPVLVWVTYGGLLLDFGCWWLMRANLVFAVGRGLGHAMFVAGFLAASSIAVHSLWWPRSAGR